MEFYQLLKKILRLKNFKESLDILRKAQDKNFKVVLEQQKIKFELYQHYHDEALLKIASFKIKIKKFWRSVR